MKNVKNLLLSLLAGCLVNCKAPYPAPKIEKCVHNSDNSAECADLRLDDDRQVYTRTNLENYICTNPHDEGTLYNYCADLRRRLIECERR